MEPIAVLGLVANIVQLVDAAGKAYTICHEIYTLGETVEDSRTAFTSKQLLDAYDDLVRTLSRYLIFLWLLGASSNLKDALTLHGSIQNKSFNQSHSSAVSPGSGNDLILLATQCSQTAKALQDELDSLRKSPGGGLRSTIQKARLKNKKAKTIGKLKLALDEYEKTLDSKVLIDVRQALGELGVKQEAQGQNFEQQLSRLSSGMNACQLAFADQLRSEIDKHVIASEAQHVTTREHVTAAIQDLSLSQKEQLDEQKKQQHSQQQHDHFLKSLRFSEMHTRMNDVEESHADTFQWIFEDDATRPWDNFCNWLRDDDGVYWINGKPGSWKSTLIKFLINDARTRVLLAQWSPGQQPLIIKFYFWLSGTEMQRSLKGFLCSVIHQIVHEDKLLVEQLLSGDSGLLSKRNPGDWSKKELRTTLVHSIGLLNRPLCIFLDGLDEFDQDDDVDQILNLLDDVSKSGTTKICVSSRPEPYIAKRMQRYKQLQLQDLTAKDMDICIRTTLEYTRTQCLPAFIDETYLDWIISTIAKKADGVFLWVHYALSSLVRGMRNEDTFKDLLRRIQQLPSGMHQLYLQMWNRLNEDKKQYQEEAATYFSYVATCFEYDETAPISLFELLVALASQLQIVMLDDLKPQDPIGLTRDCEALKTRVLTRSAGLLEFSIDEKFEDTYSLSTVSSGSIESMVDTNDLAGSLSNQSHKSLDDATSQDEVDSVPGIHPRNDQAFAAGSPYSSNTLTFYYRTKLKYLHRTARDFLMDTEDGRKLSGSPPDPPVTRSRNILRARIAALLQGYIDFDETHIEDIMTEIKYHFHGHSDHETELVVALRRVCQSLSTPGVPKYHIGYRAFWREKFPSFECCAACYGFPEYVQKFVQDRSSYIDPYCRGLLAYFAASSTASNFDADMHYSRKMALVSWLASNGADLHTLQTDIPYEHRIIFARSPASEILCAIDRIAKLEEGTTMLTRLYDTICTILPNLASRACNDIVSLLPRKNAQLFTPSGWWRPQSGKGALWVQMSIPKLCFLVMEGIEQKIPHRPQWR